MTNPVITALGWTLFHSLWQGALAAVVAAGADRLMRKKQANLRYLAYFSILLVWLAAAVLTFGYHLGQINPKETTGAWLVSTSQVAPETNLKSMVEPYLVYFVVLWGCGLALGSFRLLKGFYGVRTLVRSGSRASSEWTENLEHLARLMGIKGKFELRLVANLDSPAVVGAFRAVVLLPAAVLTQLSTSQIEALLVHELAHFARRDYLANIVQMVLEALFFYHPAVWWISGKVREERELACDEQVIALLKDRTTYVTALAQLEEIRGAKPRLAVAAKGGSLLNRIQRILGENHYRPLPSARLAAGLLATASVAVLSTLSQVAPAQQVAPLIESKPEKPVKLVTLPPDEQPSTLAPKVVLSPPAKAISRVKKVSKLRVSNPEIQMELDDLDSQAKPVTNAALTANVVSTEPVVLLQEPTQKVKAKKKEPLVISGDAVFTVQGGKFLTLSKKDDPKLFADFEAKMRKLSQVMRPAFQKGFAKKAADLQKQARELARAQMNMAVRSKDYVKDLAVFEKAGKEYEKAVAKGIDEDEIQASVEQAKAARVQADAARQQAKLSREIAAATREQMAIAREQAAAEIEDAERTRIEAEAQVANLAEAGDELGKLQTNLRAIRPAQVKRTRTLNGLNRRTTKVRVPQSRVNLKSLSKTLFVSPTRNTTRTVPSRGLQFKSKSSGKGSSTSSTINGASGAGASSGGSTSNGSSSGGSSSGGSGSSNN